MNVRSLLPHLTKFTLYVVSGASAAVADFGSYFLMLHWGVWYIAASVASGVIGFSTAFLLHKYVVFNKRKTFMKHLTRYFLVDMTNLTITTGLLYVLVDQLGWDPRPSKFVALAPVILWNFFVYKLIVYV